MVRLLSSVILFAFFFAVAGCGDTRRDPAPETAVKKKGTIGFSALTLTNPFFQVIADNMKAEAAKHGYDVIVVSADNDVKKQADQVQEFIVKGVAAIVLNPCDSQSIGPAIAQANAAGIPVFTNDNKYAGSAGKVVCHIATNNYQGGKLAGEAMVKLLGQSGGKVAILHFPQTESCQMRVKGFLEIVNAHNAKAAGNQIKVVATLDGGGARDAGFRAAKDAIEANPDLAAIFAINDPSGLGAAPPWRAPRRPIRSRSLPSMANSSASKRSVTARSCAIRFSFPTAWGESPSSRYSSTSTATRSNPRSLSDLNFITKKTPIKIPS